MKLMFLSITWVTILSSGVNCIPSANATPFGVALGANVTYLCSGFSESPSFIDEFLKIPVTQCIAEL